MGENLEGFMKLDLFILGCVAEKPVKLKNLLEIAEYIRLDRWLNYSSILILERIVKLSELNLIKICEQEEENLEKQLFSSTDEGLVVLQKSLRDFIKDVEIDPSMFVMFLTFSNHLSREEVMNLVLKKIKLIDIKIIKTKELIELSKGFEKNKIRELSLRSLLSFREAEKIVYMELLSYTKNNLEWSDFLLLEEKWSLLV
jgi:hypothetical protein